MPSPLGSAAKAMIPPVSGAASAASSAAANPGILKTAFSKLSGSTAGSAAVKGASALKSAGGTILSAGAAGVGWAAGTGVAKGAMSAFSKTSFWFLIFSFIISYLPGIGSFNGFDLSYTLNDINSGNFFAIYQFFRFNVLFLLLIVVFVNTQGQTHILKVWLSIILLLYLISTYPMLSKFISIQGGIEITMLILTAVYLSFFKTNRDDFVATVIVIWLLSNLFMRTSFTNISTMLHFIFFVVFFFIFGMSKKYAVDSTQIKWWLVILIIFDFFMPYIFKFAFPAANLTHVRFLFLGTLFFAQIYEPSWFTGCLLIFMLLYYIIEFTALGQVFGMQLNTLTNPDEKNKEALSSLNPFTWWDRLNKRINETIGEQYEGQVDTNSKKELGVYIKELSTNKRQFFDNEEIVLDATLTALNFENEEGDTEITPIEVFLSCAAYKSGKDTPIALGNIYPGSKLTIENYDVENIECIFEPGDLERGSYEIRFKAEFNFKTEAYLKRYFVSKNVISALRKSGKIKQSEDILKINQIQDTKPIAKNSVGPVEIKANERVPVVIEVDSLNEVRQIFGVQLVNKWSGTIKKVSDIQFFIPEGVKLDLSRCDFTMKNSTATDLLKYEGYNFYHLGAVDQRLREVNKEIAQSCGIVINPSDVSLILKPGDVTTRYFRMIAEYTYQLEQKTNINIDIQKGKSLVLHSTNKQILTASTPIICELRTDEDTLSSDVVFNLYENEILTKTSPSQSCISKSCSYTFISTPKKGTLLKCEATITNKLTGDLSMMNAITKVKNSPPTLKSVTLLPSQVTKGTILTCTAEAQDADNDPLIAQFDFDGVRVSPSQNSCDQSCSAQIPTDSISQNSVVKCLVTVFDQEDKSQTNSSQAKVLVN